MSDCLRASSRVLAPVTTGLGEIYQYYLDGPEVSGTTLPWWKQKLTNQRTVQDWVLRPLLKSVPGVIDVNGLGGFVKQFQVLVRPDKLRKYRLTLRDIFDAVEKNNANAGGSVLEQHAERAIVRGLGLIKALPDIERIVVKEADGVPVFIARCGRGPHQPCRAAWCNRVERRTRGRSRHGPHVAGRKRTRGRGGRKAARRDYPAGRTLAGRPQGRALYDRIELVRAAIHTVRDALIEGVVLVTLVFFLFLGHARSAVVVTVSLFVTPLITFLVMQRAGLSITS